MKGHGSANQHEPGGTRNEQRGALANLDETGKAQQVRHRAHQIAAGVEHRRRSEGDDERHRVDTA